MLATQFNKHLQVPHPEAATINIFAIYFFFPWAIWKWHP